MDPRPLLSREPLPRPRHDEGEHGGVLPPCGRGSMAQRCGGDFRGAAPPRERLRRARRGDVAPDALRISDRAGSRRRSDPVPGPRLPGGRRRPGKEGPRDPALPAAAPGRMAPATAFSLLLLGSAILCLGRRGGRWIAQYLALATALLSLLALMGYAYDVRSLYQIVPYSS